MVHILLTPDEIKEIIQGELQAFFYKLPKEHKLNEDVWFNLKELSCYLPDKPKPSTVYGWVSKRQIPYHKKSKKLQFLKREIDEWLNEGGTKDRKGIIHIVDNFLLSKKNKQA